LVWLLDSISQVAYAACFCSNTAYLLSALPRKAAYGLKALVEQKQAA